MRSLTLRPRAAGLTLCGALLATSVWGASPFVWHHLNYGTDRGGMGDNIAFVTLPLADYTTKVELVDAFAANLRGRGGTWQDTYLRKSQNRFDAWIYVTAAQAGTWHIRQIFDDYMSISFDNNLALANGNYNRLKEADYTLTEGWHAVAFVFGDTYGGYGWDQSTYPLRITLPSGTEVEFTETAFTTGEPLAETTGEFAPALAPGETVFNTFDLAAGRVFKLNLGTSLVSYAAPVFGEGAKIKVVPPAEGELTGSYTLLRWETGTAALPENAAALLDLTAIPANLRTTVTKTAGETGGAIQLQIVDAAAPFVWRRKGGVNTAFSVSGLNDYASTESIEGFEGCINAWQNAWQAANMKTAQNRIDGWIFVREDQAGAWELWQKFDDFMSVSLDNVELVRNPTYATDVTVTNTVAAGWHSFSLVFGDTGGGYGSEQNLYPLQIKSIDGDETKACNLDEAAFKFGSPEAEGDFTVAVEGEVACLTLNLAANSRFVLDPEKTSVRLYSAPTFGAGAKIAFPDSYKTRNAGMYMLVRWEDGDMELPEGVELADLFDADGYPEGVNPEVKLVEQGGWKVLAVQLDSTVSVDVPAGETLTYTEAVAAGVANFVKTGKGTLVLAAANNCAGETRIEGGSVVFQTAEAIPPAGKLVLSAETVAGVADTLGEDALSKLVAAVADTSAGGFVQLQLTADRTVDTALTLAGNAGFATAGAYRLTLTGANSWTGPTRLAGGTTLVAAPGAGLPTAAALVLANGIWAPGVAVAAFAAGKFAIAADATNVGISAVDAPLALQVGDGSEELVMPANARLTLNPEGANAALSIANPIKQLQTDAYLDVGPYGHVTLNGALYPEVDTRSLFLKGGDGVTLAGPLGKEGQRYYFRPEGTVTYASEASALSTFILGIGTLSQASGTVDVSQAVNDSIVGGPENADNTGEAVYNLSGGSATFGSNFQVGRSNNGRVNQTGGDLVCNAWISLGRYADRTGLYNLSGGTVTALNQGVIVGEAGPGTLNVSDTGVLTAKTLQVGNGALNVTDGGTVKADAVMVRGNLSASVNLDGGTLGVAADGEGTVENWFSGFMGAVNVGTKGATLDVGSADVFAGDLALDAVFGGAVTKTGSGSLTLGTLPTATRLDVAAGTVALAGRAGTNLVHRWSFNGSLVDSVGGQDAVMSDNNLATYVESKVLHLAGGANADNPAYVKLGANILPTTGPVTIETWATVASNKGNQKLFSIGNDGNDLLFTCHENSSVNYPRAGIGNRGTGTIPFGTEIYVAVRFTPRTDGKTQIAAFTFNAVTGVRLGTYQTVSEKGVQDINQTDAWLGKAWWPDPIPEVNFNEFRVWNEAFSEQQMSEHVMLGPDALPQLVDETDAGDNVYPAEPSAELVAHDYLARRWSFNGSVVDSVSGRTAELQGKTALSTNNRSVRFEGGVTGSSWIELGTDVLPKTGPVTLELWVTHRGPRRGWEKLFSFGENGANCVLYTLEKGNENGKVSFGLSRNGTIVDNLEGSAQVPLNTPCQITLVLTPMDGGTYAHSYVRNARTGELIDSFGAQANGWTVGGINQSSCRLNRSFWGDGEGSIDIDEFRVWSAALSEAQVAKNCLLGPDSLPQLSATTVSGVAPVVNVAAGATLDLLGGTLEQNTMTGAGTVQNGSLAVTGVLSPGGDGAAGTLTLKADTKVPGTIRLDAGDLVVCEGTLDLTGLTVELVDPANCPGTMVFATSEAGAITGRPSTLRVPGTTYLVSVTPTEARVQKVGMTLIFR